MSDIMQCALYSVAPATVERHAVLYDTGCTELLTNNLHGLVGQLQPFERRLATPTGELDLKLYGKFVRTLYGVDGRSYTFEADWCYLPLLPFDVVGHAALKRLLGAFYVDCDYDGSRNGPTVRFHTMPPASLQLARSRSGLEWLAYRMSSAPAADVPPFDDDSVEVQRDDARARVAAGKAQCVSGKESTLPRSAWRVCSTPVRVQRPLATPSHDVLVSLVHAQLRMVCSGALAGGGGGLRHAELARLVREFLWRRETGSRPLLQERGVDLDLHQWQHACAGASHGEEVRLPAEAESARVEELDA